MTIFTKRPVILSIPFNKMTLFIIYKDYEITAKKLPFVSQNTDLNAFFNKQIESTNNEEDE